MLKFRRLFCKYLLIIGLWLVLAAGALLLKPLPVYAHTRITTDVNWSEAIRAIMRKKCMVCHHPGGLAPDYIDFTTYGTDTAPGARAWAVSIEEEIMTGRMPPWKPDKRFSSFSNKRFLTDEERDFILAWIGGGAPQGPYRNLPVPPEFLKTEWVFGEPDLVFELKEPRLIPGGQANDHVEETFDVAIEEDVWITGFEFQPQNPKNILSMTAYLHDPDEEPFSLEVEVQTEYDPFADEDAKVPTRMRESPKGPHFIGQWMRGDDPVLFPDEAGRLVRVGSKVELRIVYLRPDFADDSIPIEDQSKFGLHLAGKDEVIDRLVESLEISKSDFVVKSNETNYETRTSFTLTESIHLLGVFPQLGFLGKAMELRAIYPDGRPATLLYIPNYEHKWASSYVFETPVATPAGTQIELIGHYDNTLDNWANPNDPPIDVRAGTGLNDARLLALLDYTLDDHLAVEEIFVPKVRDYEQGSGMTFTGAAASVTPLESIAAQAAAEAKDEPKGDLPPTIAEIFLQGSTGTTVDQIYWCPMRGSPCELRDYHGPGQCEDCWMELRPKSFFLDGKSLAPDSSDWELGKNGLIAVFWCPNRGRDDHSLVDYSSPGACGVCGENLLHRSRFEDVKTWACLTPTCSRKGATYYGPGLCPECGQPVQGLGHMDHNPVHGGWQFFMSDNLYHHLEGTMPEPGEFRLYFYDDWKQSLDPRNFSGNLYLEEEDPDTGDVTETVVDLFIETEGDDHLTARLEKELPVAFYTLVWLAGEEKRYDFEFDALTPPPNEAALADAIRLHSHVRETVVIPQTAGGIVSEISNRGGILAELVQNEDWYALHNPAFDAKDLVAALSEKQDGLNVRKRGALKKVIGLINRGANALDRAGDAGDEARVQRAYETFSEGLQMLRNIYPDSQ